MHHPVTDDAQASLRIELLGELVAGQFALEAALADLSAADAPVRDKLRGQLSQIAGLRQQIGTARGNALTTLRAEVIATAGNASATVQAARSAATPDAAQSNSIATLAATAREQTAAVMAGMKDFDPYLRFANAQDEADYRRREEERRATIAVEQAKHTPEGDLNAAGAATGQMADAATHGAANSPEFQHRWNGLVDSTAKLRAQLIRDGKDVSEFDAHLGEDLRRVLKSKGLSDAQIDARFAAQPDPLEAAKAIVAEQHGAFTEKEVNALVHRASEFKDTAEERAAVVSVSTSPASVPASAMEAMADLKALGVVAEAHDSESPPMHGVTTSTQPSPSQRISVRP